MEVLPGVRAAVPGTTFLVGVNLKIEPEWHIYWHNPGDSGVPTTIEVDVTDGFKVNRILFPGPHRFEPGDGSVSFGYEDEVLLLIEIATPEDTGDLEYVDVTVRGDWLVCKQACFSGSGSGSARVKIGAAGDEVKALNRSRFAKWLALMPTGLDALDSERVSWSGSRAQPTLNVVLEPGETADYFPLETLGVKVDWKAESAKESGAVGRFNAMYELENPSADPAPVLGVLKIERDGTARYYEVVHGFDE
jgi:DsbC/DsbD-like thiol-disulfide interchange protein